MKTISTLAVLCLFIAGAVATGCGDDETTSAATTTSSSSSTGGSGGSGGSTGDGGSGGVADPSAPTLGVQIDRMGRPAINTALNATLGNSEADKNTAHDAWNGEADTSKWAGFAAAVSTSLGFLDSLDTVCGNQAVSCDDEAAGCYATLGTVLANDVLVLNTAGTTPAGYLGVELEFITMAADNAAKGGRTLSGDVIDTTYGVVAGVPTLSFSDGVDAPDKAPSADWPFLADANN
jgi:hypothetical protein